MIIHLKQFLSLKDYAQKNRLTPRTTRDRIKQRKIGSHKICCVRLLMDDVEVKKFVEDKTIPHIDTNKLLCVADFAKSRKYSPDTIYQNIIAGNINAVTAGNRVFLNPDDETVVAFQQKVKPKTRKR